MRDASTAAPKPGRQLLRRPDPEATARLFCLPYSGCGASVYHRWPRRIGDIEVCLIQPPARETRVREPHYLTYERLAEDLLEPLSPYLDVPYGIFGHCGGALAGFELARQIVAAGRPAPGRLFMSSQVAPHDGPYGRYLHLNDEALAGELRNLIVNLGGNPVPALVEMGLELLSRDLDANRAYRVDGLVPAPAAVTAIGWSEDTEIPIGLMNGWRDTTPYCRYVQLEGNHFAFLGAPDALLAEFARDLTRVASPSPAGA